MNAKAVDHCRCFNFDQIQDFVDVAATAEVFFCARHRPRRVLISGYGLQVPAVLTLPRGRARFILM